MSWKREDGTFGSDSHGNDTFGNRFLHDVVREFKRQKELADKAMAQVSDEGFAASDDEEQNSIALIAKHMAGNMRSRWRDFLTSDGEKPDRNRDTEFDLGDDDDRDAIMERWEEGWRTLLGTLDTLTSNDLERNVKIRGEEHLVWQAIMRQLSHYAYHVGQIVYVAKARRSGAWKTLSVARGKSAEFAAMPDSYLGGKNE